MRCARGVELLPAPSLFTLQYDESYASDGAVSGYLAWNTGDVEEAHSSLKTAIHLGLQAVVPAVSVSSEIHFR